MKILSMLILSFFLVTACTTSKIKLSQNDKSLDFWFSKRDLASSQENINIDTSESIKKAEEKYKDEFIDNLAIKYNYEKKDEFINLVLSDTQRFKTIQREDLLRFKMAVITIETIFKKLAYQDSDKLQRLTNQKYANIEDAEKIQFHWATFYGAFKTLDRIAVKYTVDLKFYNKEFQNIFFEAYFMGNVAQLMRFTYGARMLQFIGNNQKIAILFNEFNKSELVEDIVYHKERDFVEIRKEGSFYRFLKVMGERDPVAPLLYFKKNYSTELENLYKKPNALIDSEQRLNAYWQNFSNQFYLSLRKLEANESWMKKYIFQKEWQDSLSVFIPLIEKVGEWMGDTKIKRQNSYLITHSQVDDMFKTLEPGDILLERGNWFLSNIFLKGLWPHSLIALKSFEEAKTYFNETSINEYYNKKAINEHLGDYIFSFSEYVEKKFPEVVKRWKSKASEESLTPEIIEAVSEGVVLNNKYDCCAKDYMSAMRPRLSKLEKAKAIETAFMYYGRPYDYDFNFETNESIVCTELIVKAFAKGKDKKGLNFPYENVGFGKYGVDGKGIVKKYATEFGKENQELDFIYMLAGDENTGTARVASEPEFRNSYKATGGMTGGFGDY